MNSPRSTQKITDKVEPKNEFLKHGDIKSYFKPWTDKYKLRAFSLDHAKRSESNPTTVIWEPATSHGLASAIIHAYTLHQHLRFSPDDVWLTIAQGVSNHIWNNAESFRYLFVDHEGQEEVFIDAQDIIGYINGNFFGDWPKAIARLSDSTDQRVKKVGLKQLLECDFSTSTSVSITASQIILLDSMKKYFRYSMRGGCGIPKVTLDGTLEDWLHLQEKVAKLRGLVLNLDFWLDRLEPVVAQFISTYKGNVDDDFWSMIIYQVPYGSGTLTPCWNGWVCALFPYNESRYKLTKNSMVPSSIPSGLVNVPFKMSIEKEDFKLSFSAGFLGARQDKINDEYVVSPVIGWYISDA
ncbi:17743_t:CDS:1 [Funneliformis geosporum]|uniref:19629_t:CDS:1 n=1 Tax=Funneliformis geosporum TaxID=1117311 RepID=A0A9W4SU44_9GLOM|nr:19629_t:CDS:1 [Funneliformis geosporum]CAI2182482.1 17743_t:CDS:1 [Funneliformis geosporum]